MLEPIATIEKNTREDVRVGLDVWRGKNLVDVRTFSDRSGDRVGDRYATKKGVTLRIEKLPSLIAALQQARDEAIRQGLF